MFIFIGYRYMFCLKYYFDKLIFKQNIKKCNYHLSKKIFKQNIYVDYDILIFYNWSSCPKINQ